MKRTIAAVLSAAFIFTSSMQVYAEPKFNYTFEQAAQMAINNSVELKSADRTIQKSSDTYDMVEKATPKNVIFSASNFKKFISDQVDPQVKLENSYYALQQSFLQKKSIEKNILLNLRQAIIDIQKNEMTLSESKLQQNLKNNELNALEARYSVGLIARKEYDSKKLAIEKTINQLDRVDKSLEIAYRNLNFLLGREDERDIIVHLDDTIIPLEKLDLEKIKNDLKKNDTTINALSNQKYLNSMNLGLTEEKYEKYDLKKFTTSMRDDIDELYETAQKDNDNAKKSYDNAVETFDKNFNDLIENMQNIYTDIEALKKDIADENENLNIYKMKYESGLMSTIEYNTVNTNLTLLEDKLKNLELDLNMKYAKLLIWSDLKKVVKE